MPELTVMMVPAPRAIRCGVNASMTRMVPRRLVSIVFSAVLKCAGSRRSSGIMTPDMVTTVSRPGVPAISGRGPDRCCRRRSRRWKRRVNPLAASSLSRSVRRLATMTVLPAAAKRRASSRPIPEVAPPRPSRAGRVSRRRRDPGTAGRVPGLSRASACPARRSRRRWRRARSAGRS